MSTTTTMTPTLTSPQGSKALSDARLRLPPDKVGHLYGAIRAAHQQAGDDATLDDLPQPWRRFVLDGTQDTEKPLSATQKALKALVAIDPTTGTSLLSQALKGDVAGHAFHGNQYRDGTGGNEVQTLNSAARSNLQPLDVANHADMTPRQKQDRAYELKQHGYTLRAIADHLGYAGTRGAHYAIGQAQTRAEAAGTRPEPTQPEPTKPTSTGTRPPVGELQLTAGEMKQLQGVYKRASNGGNVPAGMAAVAAKMSKMLGMDKPAKRLEWNERPKEEPDLYRGCDRRGTEGMFQPLDKYNYGGGMLNGPGIYTATEEWQARSYATPDMLHIFFDSDIKVAKYSDLYDSKVSMVEPLASNLGISPGMLIAAYGGVAAMALGYQAIHMEIQGLSPGTHLLLDRGATSMALHPEPYGG